MKIKHIRNKQEFARVLEKGAKQRGKAISLYVLADQEAKKPCIGVIIPKSMAPLAVQRNHMRRLIYAVFQEKAVSRAAAGVFVVVRLIKNIKEEKKAALSLAIRDELKALLFKAGISW